MSLDPVRNFGKSTVLFAYDDTATTVVVATGEGAKYPDPSSNGAFNLVWFNATDYPDPADDPDVEIVRCTGRTGDTLTVIRAQEGTAASVKNVSGKVYQVVLAVTKKMIDDIEDTTGTVLSRIFLLMGA